MSGGGGAAANGAAGHGEVSVVGHTAAAVGLIGSHAPYDVAALHSEAAKCFGLIFVGHVHTAALLGLAAYDAAAPHHELRAGTDVHTAAVIITDISAGDDPAADDPGALAFVQHPKVTGILDKLVYGGGVAVHQRQRAALYLDNAAAAGYLQHKAVQVQRHVTPNDQRMRQVHIIAQKICAFGQYLFFGYIDPFF